MGRNIEHRDEAVWYVPDIDDNRDDPDPFRVELMPMDGVDYNRLQQSIVGKVTKRSGNYLEKAHKLTRRIVAKYCMVVESYSIKTANGDTLQPTTGSALVKAVIQGPPAELEVLEDIVLALRDQSTLREGLVKNSDTLSASSAPRTATLPSATGHAFAATRMVPKGIPSSEVG